jgi:tetratricopeptide (TPR) repeat protein
LIGTFEPGAVIGAAGGIANLEKAIDIKRRAQRCIQNGDLDGALKEYEKLIAVQDSDPYNFVLLADLLYKKGDMVGAAQRYVASIDAYEKATLYKNAIAVGKKMMRLSLSPTLVLQKLAALHALDGLGTEAALYYQQYAEQLIRDNRGPEAADALRKAFEACPENVKSLERLAEVQVLEGDNETAARTLGEAAVHYQSAGLLQDADRCRIKASTINNGTAPAPGAPGTKAHPPTAAAVEPERPRLELPSTDDSDGIELGSAHGGARPPRAPSEQSSIPEPARLEIEQPFAAGGEPEGLPSEPVSLEASITHSMELPPDGGDHEPTGPPALEPARAQAPAETPATPVASEESAPGLRFTSPGEEVEPAAAGAETPEPAAAPAAASPPAGDSPVAVVERLLREAREHFRKGEREEASASLVRAAQLYDEMGHFDSAATIYRNLSRSTHASQEVMSLWLRNCEARHDRVEAAQVACELGDRALNDGDMDAARDWFQRASGFDASNEIAKRRLQKLGESRGGGVSTAAPDAEPTPEGGRVEVAVGRSEAVTFDLGSLVSEFQRGVESQISGDPQGHYDLGMAYREMGLLEQAIESFRTAGRDPGFAQRCAEMVGRSLLDQGRFDEAAQEFMVALELPGLSTEGANDLRYQLGLAHEAAGRMEAALAEFERVYASMPSYPDVALKIRMLRKALESS